MPALACPLCRQPLAREAARYACAAGHAFDVAREGYVNLLPVQRKKSREPGDNPAMVQARRQFLAAGHYAPLRDAVVAQATALAPTAVLDIGCGEGDYTAALASVAPDVTGLDISKVAIQRAARAHPGITWIVGSSAQLPLVDAAVDLVCSLFSPLPAAEMRRVLRPGGHLLVATPAADHLAALRAALFDEVRPHRPEKFVEALGAEFTLEQASELRFTLALDAASLACLLLMTPYAWRARPERREAMAVKGGFVTGAAFMLFLLQRR